MTILTKILKEETDTIKSAVELKIAELECLIKDDEAQQKEAQDSYDSEMKIFNELTWMQKLSKGAPLCKRIESKHYLGSQLLEMKDLLESLTSGRDLYAPFSVVSELMHMTTRVKFPKQGQQ